MLRALVAEADAIGIAAPELETAKNALARRPLTDTRYYSTGHTAGPLLSRSALSVATNLVESNHC